MDGHSLYRKSIGNILIYLNNLGKVTGKNSDVRVNFMSAPQKGGPAVQQIHFPTFTNLVI